MLPGHTGGSACLTFYYHMFGANIDELSVYLGNTKVFSKKGAQGNMWKKAEVSINDKGNVRYIKVTVYLQEWLQLNGHSASQSYHRYPKPYFKLKLIELGNQIFHRFSNKINSQVFR